MDLSSVPRIFESIAVSRIRKGADPPGVPVLLDWEGRFFDSLGLSEESSNVVLVGPDGTIRLIVHGPPGPELEKKVAGGIDLLRESDDD